MSVKPGPAQSHFLKHYSAGRGLRSSVGGADPVTGALQVTVRFVALRPGQKKAGASYIILRWQDDVRR